MSKRHFFFFLSTLLLALILWPYRGGKTAFSSPQNFTVPTRTPTSAPPEPTDDDNGGGGGDGGGSNPTPVPSSPPPTATAVPVTLAPTPDGGILPTAEACGSQPTVRALNTVNVRLGPGTTYEAATQLVYLEVRYIVGRAATAEWWLIELDDGETGWVADAAVVVSGYTDIVPIVPPPPVNGATPTPGAPWHPTPPPMCTVTPTATPPPTETPTATPQPTNTATATAEMAAAAEAGGTAPAPSATPTVAATHTAVPTPSATTESQAAAIDTTNSTQPTAVPLDNDVAPPATTPNFLPIAGLILIAAAIFVAIARRQQGKQTS